MHLIQKIVATDILLLQQIFYFLLIT